MSKKNIHIYYILHFFNFLKKLTYNKVSLIILFVKENVHHYLEEAQRYNLLAEVVLSALTIAKNNPELSTELILDMACDEWDV